MGAKCNHEGPYEGGKRSKVEGGDGIMEANVGVMWSEDGRREHEPKI